MTKRVAVPLQKLPGDSVESKGKTLSSLGIGLGLGLGLGLGMGDFTEASAPRPIRSIVTLYSTV